MWECEKHGVSVQFDENEHPYCWKCEEEKEREREDYERK